MAAPRKILLIDNHTDNRALLARTLLRKFPKVILSECKDRGTAIEAAGQEQVDVVVLHRTNDAEAVDLITAIRKVNKSVPILVLSGVDRSATVLKAGATKFLNYDEWLMVGSAVEALVSPPESAAK
jgi:response regulator RpfG family c-di-GMP phosphodiesterase